MPVNDKNITAGCNEMIKQLDHATNRQQAEVVADRLRADYMDCLGQGEEGVERWNHIVIAMRYGEQKGRGFDIQVTNTDKDLPTLTLVDSQKGVTVPGLNWNLNRDELRVNEDHRTSKGFRPNPEEGIANPRSVKPLEMQ